MPGFAAAWGAFPVLTAYVAQTSRLSAWPPSLAALFAFALSHAQRRLSTPARLVRRRAGRVDGRMTLAPTGRPPDHGPNAAGARSSRRCAPCRGRRPARPGARRGPARLSRLSLQARVAASTSRQWDGLAVLLADHPSRFEVPQVGQGLADRRPPHEALDLRPTAGSTSCGSAIPQAVSTPARMAAIASSMRAW